jgi:DNA modification methylase
MEVLSQIHENNFSAYNADCVEVCASLPSNSVDFTIFSPPFSSLYTYSNSERDMGNSKNDEEFFMHFGFLVENLFRLTKPGRIVAFHCMNIPAMKERDGYIGIKDFRGDLIRCFQKQGFIYHSEHVIWKDPLIEATRTKAIGLMHKQLCKDSTMCRSGLPDYLIAMRKPGENQDMVSHADGLDKFYGENPPTSGNLSHERWRRYASPVWMDIRQTYTLQASTAREQDDERHICPLQLDVIERGLQLWSRKNDVVLSPFMGIGSEGYVAIKDERRFIGIELKTAYFNVAVDNLRKAENERNELTLF